MGGTVATTIRKANGEVIKMARKTGSYDGFFFSQKFNEGRIDEAIDDYVSTFNEMRNDFLSGEPYEHAMSPVYAWCEHCAPVDYGLVVIDFQNQKIHSMQNHGKPGMAHLMNFSHNIKQLPKIEQGYDFAIRHNKLWVYSDKKSLGCVHDVFTSDLTLEKMKDLIRQRIKEEYQSADSSLGNDFFEMELQPLALKKFEHLYYEESMQDVARMAKNLVADNFEFNAQEKKMWIDFHESLQEKFDLEDDEANEILSDDEYEIKCEQLIFYHKQELVKALKKSSPKKRK